MEVFAELIDEYMRIGEKDGESDYKYFSCHGELVRCIECRYHNDRMNTCSMNSGDWRCDEFCSKGEKRVL